MISQNIPVVEALRLKYQFPHPSIRCPPLLFIYKYELHTNTLTQFKLVQFCSVKMAIHQDYESLIQQLVKYTRPFLKTKINRM